MKSVQLSIIIPTVNEADHIGHRLREIIALQAGFVKEVLVVDGGSTDQTVEKAQSAGARVILSARGRAAQMNRGAREATGDILYFLHSDTRPPEAFDREIVNAVRRGWEFGCFRLKFDWNHPLLRFYSYFTRFRTILVRFGDQSLFVRKKSFFKAGGFDENLVVMEDQKIYRDLYDIGNFYLSERSVLTSARSYRKVGPAKLQVIFSVIWIGYYLGVSQQVLSDLYNNLISG